MRVGIAVVKKGDKFLLIKGSDRKWRLFSIVCGEEVEKELGEGLKKIGIKARCLLPLPYHLIKVRGEFSVLSPYLFEFESGKIKIGRLCLDFAWLPYEEALKKIKAYERLFLTAARNAGKKGLALVSACLVGFRCRYDGKDSLRTKLRRMFERGLLFPACPEQLGGLSVPRDKCFLTKSGEEVLRGKGKVVSRSGIDCTAAFAKGAEVVLSICEQFWIKRAILKQYSPSCGCGWIYTKEGKRRGKGVLTALLLSRGIRCEGWK